MNGVITVNGVDRILNLVPSLPDLRDYRFSLPPPVRLQDTYDLLAGFTYDQGNQGSCTANAQGKDFRMLLKNQGMSDFEVSRAMIYYESRKLEGTTGQDSGATIADSMRGMYLSGACSNAVMPYRDSDYRTAPSPAAYQEGQDHQVLAYGLVGQSADEIGAALDAKHPVSIGFVVYSNFAPDANGIIPMPAGSALGGHNVLITGRYHSRRLYIIDNSWGSFWGVTISGQAGRALLPYDYVHNPQITFELKTMTNVEGVIVPPPPPPAPAPTKIVIVAEPNDGNVGLATASFVAGTVDDGGSILDAGLTVTATLKSTKGTYSGNTLRRRTSEGLASFDPTVFQNPHPASEDLHWELTAPGLTGARTRTIVVTKDAPPPPPPPPGTPRKAKRIIYDDGTDQVI